MLSTFRSEEWRPSPQLKFYCECGDCCAVEPCCDWRDCCESEVWNSSKSRLLCCSNKSYCCDETQVCGSKRDPRRVLCEFLGRLVWFAPQVVFSILVIPVVYAMAGLARGLIASYRQTRHLVGDSIGNPKIGRNMRLVCVVTALALVPFLMLAMLLLGIVTGVILAIGWPASLVCGPNSSSCKSATCGVGTLTEMVTAFVLTNNKTPPIKFVCLTEPAAFPQDLDPSTGRLDTPLLMVLVYLAIALVSVAVHAVLVPVVLLLRLLWYIPAMMVIFVQRCDVAHFNALRYSDQQECCIAGGERGSWHLLSVSRVM